MAVSSPATAEDHELLEAARSGDEGAFRRIVDEHRAELTAHCYRMLGSIDDPEDAFQELLVRVWRGLPGVGGRSSLRTWLYRIATNACLDGIDRRSKRILPIEYGPSTEGTGDPGPPLSESVWIEPFPDETVLLPHGYAAPEASYE